MQSGGDAKWNKPHSERQELRVFPNIRKSKNDDIEVEKNYYRKEEEKKTKEKKGGEGEDDKLLAISLKDRDEICPLSKTVDCKIVFKALLIFDFQSALMDKDSKKWPRMVFT